MLTSEYASDCALLAGTAYEHIRFTAGGVKAQWIVDGDWDVNVRDFRPIGTGKGDHELGETRLCGDAVRLKSANGNVKGVVEVGEGWLNGKGKARVRGEESRKWEEGQSTLAKAALKPHPPQVQNQEGNPKLLQENWMKRSLHPIFVL